ncbi:hypothetical protein HIM_02118 [Hirsutella minnesotensis 3608]|nr:hypothetical protein HIM_02118 [Hirsutella minnesotensis 3608]
MTAAIPSIACLGVIGRNNNPLHMSVFPSHDAATDTFAPIRSPLQFSLLLSSTIDVFELRAKHNAAAGVGLSGDVGLLHAVDDRLDTELKPVFRAMQNAYVRLLQNPFFDPDEHAPLGGRGGKKITSKRFVDEMRRIGEGWTPGVVSF